jgi:hypothetical protein
MDDFILSENKIVRLSNSPAGSPKIVPSPPSPAQSVHLEPMGLINLQPDPGLRTTDFFDDSSSEDEVSVEPTRGHTSIMEPSSSKKLQRSPAERKNQSSYLGGNNASDFQTQCGDDNAGTNATVPEGYLPAPGGGFLKLTSTPGTDVVKRMITHNLEMELYLGNEDWLTSRP